MSFLQPIIKILILFRRAIEYWMPSRERNAPKPIRKELTKNETAIRCDLSQSVHLILQVFYFALFAQPSGCLSCPFISHSWHCGQPKNLRLRFIYSNMFVSQICFYSGLALEKSRFIKMVQNRRFQSIIDIDTMGNNTNLIIFTVVLPCQIVAIGHADFWLWMRLKGRSITKKVFRFTKKQLQAS